MCASSGAHDLSIFFVMCVLAAVSRRAYDRASNDVIILPPSEHRVHTFGCEMIITGLCTTSSICSVNETALETLHEVKEDINSAHSFAGEATYINQNFSVTGSFVGLH
jgi:hypothetical protein